LLFSLQAACPENFGYMYSVEWQTECERRIAENADGSGPGLLLCSILAFAWRN